MLRADVGPEPSLPPLNGWKFLQYDQSDQLKYTEDVNLTCCAPAASPSCTLKVSLSGLAKEALGCCEGSYKTTGLTSMGRQVNNDFKLPISRSPKKVTFKPCYAKINI